MKGERALLPAAGLVGAATIALLVCGAWQRPPWLDELTTLYFVSDGFPELLKRQAGDPHPIGYYMALLGWAQLELPLGALRLASLGFYALLGFLVARLIVVPSAWAGFRRQLWLALPAAGTEIAVRSGTDLRMYGPLSVFAVVYALALNSRTRGEPVEARARRGALIGWTVLAETHSWGLLLASSLLGLWALLHGARTWSEFRRRELWGVPVVLGALVLGYWVGPLGRTGSDWQEFLSFEPKGALGSLLAGIAQKKAFLGLLLAAYGASWLVAVRARTLRRPEGAVLLDGAAALTALLAFAISFHTPIIKPYTWMPCVVLGSSAALLRLAALPLAYLATAGVYALQLYSLIPLAFAEHEDWSKSTREVSRLLHEKPLSRCALRVLPGDRELFHTRYFLPDVALRSARGAGGSCRATEGPCASGYFVMNHVKAARRRGALAALPGARVIETFRTALIGTAPCPLGEGQGARALGQDGK